MQWILLVLCALFSNLSIAEGEASAPENDAKKIEAVIKKPDAEAPKVETAADTKQTEPGTIKSDSTANKPAKNISKTDAPLKKADATPKKAEPETKKIEKTEKTEKTEKKIVTETPPSPSEERKTEEALKAIEVMVVKRRRALALYPKAANWLPLWEQERAHTGWIKQNRSQLRRSYLENNTKAKPDESPACSFITRALYEQDRDFAFHSLDVNGDDVKDLVYAGPAECREGHLTIVWLFKKDGNQIESMTILPFLVQFIKLGATTEILSLKEGCCGDPQDIYLQGKLSRPTLSASRVPLDLTTEGSVLPGTDMLRAKGELILRSQPMLSSQYNANASETFNTAVFGNITRAYLPGAGYEALRNFTDPAGGKWVLVRVPEESAAKGYHMALDVNVGWVEEACLSASCSGLTRDRQP